MIVDDPKSGARRVRQTEAGMGGRSRLRVAAVVIKSEMRGTGAVERRHIDDAARRRNAGGQRYAHQSGDLLESEAIGMLEEDRLAH